MYYGFSYTSPLIDEGLILVVVIKNFNFLNEDISIQTFRRNERKMINTLFKLMVMSIRSTVVI